MTETVLNCSPPAPTISAPVPNDPRLAEAVGCSSPRRLSPAAGDVALGTRPRPPFECIALLLQGGGALGAYQAGVYEALAEANLHPDWIAGISIGAINGGADCRAPEARVDKLRTFWERVTAKPYCDWSQHLFLAKSDAVRQWLNQMSANLALVNGASGFFTRRFSAPWLNRAGTAGATSLYDTSTLKATLEELIDFDRLNASAMRFSIGAVNVRSGNLVYFDTETHTIAPEHIMASGALPPGFPAIEIEGEHYWDGALVSNTPLQWMGGRHTHRDTLAFQVDLWSASGELPRTIAEVSTRQKEIHYSSRTRAGTDSFKHAQRLRRAVADLLEQLPEHLQKGPEAQLLRKAADHKVYNIVHLIYRAKTYEGHSKDYEFSRASMREHWRAGYDDAVRTLSHPEVLQRPTNHEGVFTFDLDRDGREQERDANEKESGREH
jgi:NTE family protein